MTITLLCIVGTIYFKKPLLLTVPFGVIGLYMVVQIAMVPLPFFETMRFIFSLR
ncbi:hypothetical protein ACFPU1_01740 [Thalassorhabdus alkalitolerans]|uniref:Tripartite tricarboxylate transporter TctB family protein n=1 Tax=Thalassorhabdus alkalitolerans TaxID=2282697 RepID=A0ABW0YJC4_9BACI